MKTVWSILRYERTYRYRSGVRMTVTSGWPTIQELSLGSSNRNGECNYFYGGVIRPQGAQLTRKRLTPNPSECGASGNLDLSWISFTLAGRRHMVRDAGQRSRIRHQNNDDGHCDVAQSNDYGTTPYPWQQVGP
jgi:hypothetical protein